MPYYPRSSSDFESIAYPVGPAATPVQLTSGSFDTKGSYETIAASTPFTSNIVHVVVTRTFAGTGDSYYLDIATGAASSETVIIPDLITESCNVFSSFGGSGVYVLPAEIPSGSRVAARCQSRISNRPLFVGIELIRAGTTPGITSFTTHGLTGNTQALQLDPGATINTKGSYVQYIASTSTEKSVLMLHCTLRGNISPTSCTWAIDVALGSSGSEVVLIPDIRFSFMQVSATTGAQMLPRSRTFLTYVPSGSRIALRASCTTNDATDRLIDVALTLGEPPVESGSSGGEVSYVFVG